jgi:hypothetical protein
MVPNVEPNVAPSSSADVGSHKGLATSPETRAGRLLQKSISMLVTEGEASQVRALVSYPHTHAHAPSERRPCRRVTLG